MATPRFMTSADESAPIGWPRCSTIPGSLRITPVIERISVDLPAPLAPMIATHSPAATAISTPNSARNWP
jgi:hypothetical protein